MGARKMEAGGGSPEVRKMEVLRTRFCEWQPVGIDALALAPPSVDGVAVKEPRLAVGRANGTVELWDTTTWHLRLSSPGHAKRSVRGFVWVAPEEAGEPLRLLSAGLHREVTEWDLASLQPLVSLPSSGGPVWALAAARGRLYAACEDGSLRVFSLAGGRGAVGYERKLAVGSARVLSLACLGPDLVFAGGSQSRITKWSVASGACEASMKAERAGGAETLIWALASLGDCVASGDSLGLVTIWDVETCVVRHRFAQHQADVLALTTTLDGSVLLAGSIDTKISVYCHQPDADERWVFRNSEFGHTNDIRALAADGDASDLRPFVSGGVSGALRVHPLRTTLRAPGPKALSAPLECSAFSPMLQAASVSQSTRLLLCQRNADVEIWYVNKVKKAKDQAAAVDDEAAQLPEVQWLLRVSLAGAKEGRHISASAISPDGRFVAASDFEGTRLFRFDIGEVEVRCEKGLPQEVQKMGARALAFCGTSLLAIAAWKGGAVHVVDTARLRVVARFTEHRAAVSHLASSHQWLASADVEGGVHVFNLDSLQHHARVPVGGDAGAFPTALAFSADGRRLFVVLSSHTLVVFDVESQAFAADVQSLVQIPPKVVPAHARVCGIACPPGRPRKVLLWGHDFLAAVELGPPGAGGGGGDAEASPPKKRKGRRSLGSKANGKAAGAEDGDADADSCSWRSYPHMQHVLALCALDEAEWGGPCLHVPAPINGDNNAEGGGKRKRKRKLRPDTMVLTLEVSPDAAQRALPQPFERKRYSQPSK